MLSHPLVLVLAATASLAATVSSSPSEHNIGRRDPFWGRVAPLGNSHGQHQQPQQGASFKAVKKGSSSSSSGGGDNKANFWRGAAPIKRTTVPLNGVADTAMPVLAAVMPDSAPAPGVDAFDSSSAPVLAAVPGGAVSPAASLSDVLGGMPLPLARSKRALPDVLSPLVAGNAVAAAVAPLVNDVTAPVTAPIAAPVLSGNEAKNSPVLSSSPLVNVPAVNILSPGAQTTQVNAQNYAPNGTIVQGDGNRVVAVNGDKNTVTAVQGDGANLVQGDRSVAGNGNKVAYGNGNGSARGRSGGQRTVGKIAKSSSSSSSSAGSRGNTQRKAASRAKVAKASSERAPSHGSSRKAATGHSWDSTDSADEDCNAAPAVAAPTTTQWRTRKVYKTRTVTVHRVAAPTPAPQKHLLDLDLDATVDKIAKAVADVHVL
ncbi:hypothetical protein JCM10207_003440 [Rhodosporidiobolus poonsookiae]